MSALGGTCAQLLRFQNNAYDGVLVAIAPHVPHSQADQLIKAIQDLFDRSSSLLFKATHQHASFGRVTIVIPETWPAESDDKDAYYGYHEAHVRIENPSPMHGNTPYTQQPGGCGQQGDFIHLTPEFLIDNEKSHSNYGPADKVFVHEWAHFRYGVFDEYGYPDDPVYPQMYIENVDTPTLTTCNLGIKVHFPNCSIDQTTGIYNRNCTYDLDRVQTSTKSLMGFHYLDQVNYFCESDDHNKDAPTKQNILCEGKSTWDVIRSHEDFHNFKRPDGPKEPNPIKFNIVRAKRSPVFVVVDVSTNKRGTDNDTAFPLHQNLFNFVKNSLQILAHILPDGTRLGVQEFEGTYSEANLKELKEVNTNLRRNFAVFLTAKNNPATFTNMNLAITAARQQLRKENGGILVLLTAGVEPPHNVDKTISNLCETLQQDNVRVMSILYPPSEGYEDPLQKHVTLLADRTNGRNFVIHEMTHGYNTKLEVLTQFASAMLNIGQLVEPYSKDNFVVHSTGSYSGNSISGSVYNDETIGQRAKLMILKSKSEDADFSQFMLTGPNKPTIKPDQGIFNMVGSSENMMEQPIAETGRWNYSIQTSRQDQATLSIFAFSSPTSEQGTFTVRTWNDAKLGSLDPSSGKPLIIYAQVEKGNDPVIGAKVIARVERPLDNASTYTTIDVDLLDNGNGAPDVIKDDGIYSRYFTDFNVKGHYLVTVIATDDVNSKVIKATSAASSIHPRNKSIPYCCGSSVPVSESIPTGEFKRIINGGVFHVNQITIDTSVKFPPSRITDLHIDEYRPQHGQVVLAWTAPGDELDKGTANKYQVKYSTNRAQLLDPFLFEHDAASLDDRQIPRPDAAGRTQKMTITPSLDSDPKVLHYAIRAVGNNNLDKKSKISNIVSVRYPAKHLTTPTVGTSSTIPSSENPPLNVAGGLSKTHLQIIGGVLGFLFLLIVIVIITVCIIKKRKKKVPPKAVLPLGAKRDMSFKNVSLEDSPKSAPSNGNGSVYTVNKLMSSPQFMLASEVLAKHAQMKAFKERDYLDQDLKPPYAEDDDHHHHHYSPSYDHINNPVMVPAYGYSRPHPPDDYYIGRHDIGSTNNPFHQTYPTTFPFVRTSLSDKPSSSFTSLSTNEPKKDNGYFTSYEETSEDSNPVRPPGDMDSALTSSKLSLTRRIVAESQV